MDSKKPRAFPTLHRLVTVFAVSVLGVGLSLGATDASAAKKRHTAEFDRPYQPTRPKKRIKLVGGRVVLLRVPNDEKSLFDLQRDPASAGLKNVSMFYLVYKTNRKPMPIRYAGDVQATATIGRTIFHDGYGWRGFVGPFTSQVTAVPSNCYEKTIILPSDSPLYQVGQKVAVRLSFSRTRQRLTVPATITQGAWNRGSGTQIDDIAALGCPIHESTSNFPGNFIWTPDRISPASLLPKGYKTPSL